MLLPIFENRFKKDIKRLQKRGKDMNKLKNVIDKNDGPHHDVVKPMLVVRGSTQRFR